MFKYSREIISTVSGLVLSFLVVYNRLIEVVWGSRLYGNEVDLFFSFVIWAALSAGIIYGFSFIMFPENLAEEKKKEQVKAKKTKKKQKN